MNPYLITMNFMSPPSLHSSVFFVAVGAIVQYS